MVSALLENRYREIELLGRGGMGEVVRVFDTVEGREVALKRLIVEGEAPDTAALELFEREFHTLSELSHPRIIEVYDYGVSETGAYYTMELLTGSDLRSMRQVHWTLACALLRDIASSLAIIHSRRLIHADLSPRNVRCTADGRAKLLDFGAMMPMGPPRHLTGTPPFVAPETVHGFPLDGRTDIYGLGALAYFLLVGRNAYPARELAELIERWGIPPQAPRELEPSIPEALSNLVMECLQLDRSARPRTAGIVMERLCTIAALPLEEHQEVAAAYLTTPTLVGRMEQLAMVRRSYANTVGARGGVVIAEGTCGSGRSRFLSACVLEGKLSGRKVVHVAAGDAGTQEYGVARAICGQLFTLVPQSARRAARTRGALLAHVLDSDLVGASPMSAATPADRIVRALSDFVAEVSRDVDLVIAIDDADRSDDQSMALLLSIAQRSNERAPCIVLTVDSAGEGSFALDALRRHADPISLPPLTEQQAEELIQSVFGAAKHSVSLARRLHAVACGHPRAMLQLARHLVDEGIVRYEAGSFVLPERLDERDLPASLGAALARRFDALDDDAAELACILSLTDPRDVPPGRYVELTTHGDRRRAFRALDHLVRAEFLVPEGERYRLGDAAWRSVVKERLSEIELRPLHARLARHFEAEAGVNRRAFHLMRSGDAKAAALVLLAQYLKDPNEPRDPLEDYVPGLLDLLEEISNAAEHLDIPAPYKIELRMKTLGASQFVGDFERFLRLAPPLLERLKRDSGLSDYEELASVDPSERLSAAFARVQARFESIPEQKRGLPLFEAMREVARLCVMYSGISAIALDVFIIRSVPDLSPLVALSPAIGAIKQMLDATRLLLEGRSIESRTQLLKLLERLAEPDRAGLGELYHRSLRLGGLYILGLVEASLGMASAEERANELQDEPGHRVNAQRIHMTSRLVHGEMEGAAAAQRHAELLMLQEAQYQRYPGTTARSELLISTMLEDVAAIKELTERMTKAALLYPRWGIYVHLGRHYHRRFQRDFAGALAALEPAFAVTAPLDHRDWHLVAAAHVQALCDLGRSDEAVRVGREYLDTCRKLAILPGSNQVGQALASALLSTGATEEAANLADSLIEDVTSWQAGGLAVEMLYEVRARVALAQRDEEALARCLSMCRREHEGQLVPALSARIHRLMHDAQRAGMLRAQLQDGMDFDPDFLTAINLETTARTRVSDVLDPAMLENTELEADLTTTAVLLSPAR